MYLLTTVFNDNITNKTFKSVDYAVMEALKVFQEDFEDAYDKYDDIDDFRTELDALKTLIKDLETNTFNELFKTITNYEFYQHRHNPTNFSLSNDFYYGIRISEKENHYSLRGWSNLDGHLEVELSPISSIPHDDRK